MVLFTMTKSYARNVTVDTFGSAIWTERVRGNHDFELTVPASADNIRLFSVGTLIGLEGSLIVMMIDSQTMKGNVLKVAGTSLEQKLNNRFVRVTSSNAGGNYYGPNSQKSYNFTGSPGGLMSFLVQNFAISGPWLDGTNYIGLINPQRLKIPGFRIGNYDGIYMADQSIAVPYGGLYDAIKAIGDAYEIVQRIECWGEDDLVYRNWRGIDHTSSGPNPLVRFSPQLDNLGGVTEVIDGSKAKTHAWVIPSLTSVGTLDMGEATVGNDYTAFVGWDLKAALIFADDLNVSLPQMDTILAERAVEVLVAAQEIVAVDGEILPTSQYKYGTHYDLGDIVEAQGISGIIQNSRVTEFIRSHDQTGEKAYPTLVAIPPSVIPFIPGVSGGTDGQGGEGSLVPPPPPPPQWPASPSGT